MDYVLLKISVAISISFFNSISFMGNKIYNKPKAYKQQVFHNYF